MTEYFNPITLDLAAGREVLARWLDPWADGGEPGAWCAVYHQGRQVLGGGFGLASIEQGMPIGPQTRFQLASMSKQFTAAAFLVLEAQGLVSLDVPVGQLVPSLAPLLAAPTLRELLAMRAGLPEAGHLAWLATGDVHDAWRNDAHTLDVLARLAHRNRTPSGGDLYSNSHYVLAQHVGERITGQPWGQVLQRLLFTPLGMHQTTFVTRPRLALPGLAGAYRPCAEGFERRAWPVQDGAATGVVSTPDDLQRWLRNLGRNVLQPDDLTSRLTARWAGAGAPESCYRLGLRVGRFAGHTVWGHAGGIPGWKSEYYHFPDEDLSLLLLANREDVRENLLLGRLATALFGGEGWVEERVSDLAAFCGLYGDAANGRVVEVRQDLGLLEMDGVHFVRSGRTVFESTHPFFPRRLMFTQGDGGMASLVSSDGEGSFEYQRVTPAALEGPLAVEAEGLYGAPGLTEPLELSCDADGRLRCATGPRSTAREWWFANRIGADWLVLADDPHGHSQTSLRLHRGADGSVQAVELQGYRLYGLRLERVAR